jgi:cold shock CspA family protein
MSDTNPRSGTQIGLYIDIANLTWNGGRGMRHDVLRDFACRGGGQAVRLNAYSSFDPNPRDRASAGRREAFHSTLRDQGYKVIEKPVKWYTNEGGQEVAKANIDLDLAVDALLQSDKLDRVLLATGDGDFVQVVRALQNKGCRVEILAFNNVSGDLRREADLFFSGYLVPNLLPIPRSADSTIPWGDLGGFARGCCNSFDHERGFGFIRYLHSVQVDLWNTDTRRTDSPYKSVFVHTSQLPSDLELARLPDRQIVLEFKIQKRTNKPDEFEARDVVWINRRRTGPAGAEAADED